MSRWVYERLDHSEDEVQLSEDEVQLGRAPIPQSDDQFYLIQRFPYDAKINYNPVANVSTVSVKLPFEFEGETEHRGMTPFSSKLHRLCEHLRSLEE